MANSTSFTITLSLLLFLLLTITFLHFIDSPPKSSSGFRRFYDLANLKSKFSASDFKIPRPKSRSESATPPELGTKSSGGNGVESGLARARAAIRNSDSDPNPNDADFVSSIYRNPKMFYRSYMEMEKRLKVYVYEEGEIPIVHTGPCRNIYAIEGRFILDMEEGSIGKKFRTSNPKKAHVFFLPFSVVNMVSYMYKPLSYDVTPLRNFVSDYVNLVSNRYPFWNNSNGADHFMLSCHDWGPHASRGNKHLYNTSIRVLCNANSSEGFNPQKDVSLPEINLYAGDIPPRLMALWSTPNTTTPRPRPHLAFFAGGSHGAIRPTLIGYWKGKDPDLQVYEYLPKGLDYFKFMTESRFCLCPSGYEVASPRVVEAIYAECVPVIMSRSYVLPFSDILRWEAFSIQVDIDDFPRLKEILMAVSEDEYRRLVEGVRAVRKHFVPNSPAKRFDVFNMILHSVWLRRLNLRIT